MNKELLTAVLVVSFLLLAWGVEIAIDTWRPDMRDRYRCLLLVAASIVVIAVGLRFVD